MRCRHVVRDWGKERVLGLLRHVSRWGLWFGGALILLAAILIGIDVILRKFFTTSIGGADELAGYALAIGTAWGLAATLIERAHIRIDSLYVLLPRICRIILDFLGLALLVLFFALVAWHGGGVVMQSWTSGSRSQSALQIPTVIPQSLWIIGLLLFVLVGLALFADALLKLKAGDRAGIGRSIGIRSAEEDVEEEIAALKRRQSVAGNI
jgi:TRAP-type C4-dicarboxylate transport system permease small subunit